jgi:hypothetical protein
MIRRTIFHPLVHALLLLAILLAGCEEVTNVYETYPNNGRVIGNVSGRVLDSILNTAIAGAIISYADNGRTLTTTTNATGYYAITGLDPGTYSLTITAGATFATVSTLVFIPDLDEIGIVDIPTEEDFNFNINRDVMMYGFHSGIQGTAYKRIDASTIVPAAGLLVRASFIAFNLTPSYYETMTDANGAFSFTDLPSTASANVFTYSFTSDGYVFGGWQGNVNLFPNHTSQMNNIILALVQDEPFIVSNNLGGGQFGINNAIVLTFNKAMRPDQFTATLQGNSLVELNTPVWSQGNRTVTITPNEPLRLEQQYLLNLAGMATDNSAYGEVIQFRTQDGIFIRSSSLQMYDGFYAIGANDAIVIRYSEAINVADSRNVYRVNGADVPVSFSNGDRNITISAPAGGYPGAQINLFVTVYSTLAPYDNDVLNRTVVISQ